MSKKLKKSIFIILFVVLLIGILYVFLPNFDVKELSITYPHDETIFPPDIATPVFLWDDKTVANEWTIRIEFEDADEPLEIQTVSTEWTPERELWESIKQRSLEKTAQVTILGYKKIFGVKKIQSKNTFSMKTSRDEVGAPILFRSVPLPFKFAVDNMELIKWRLGNISSDEPPKIVLENMLVCGNCHSFSNDGKYLGMDVDYANDKGSYVITEISENIDLHKDKVITWSDYKREDEELTFGLLSQISPDGKYTVSTVKDRSVFVPKSDTYYSQLFFPIKGILVYYNKETGTYHELPGADDKKFVQSNPAWSPDSQYIIFAKSKVDSLKHVGNKVLLSQQDCEEFLKGNKKFRYDLYRIPFNDGKGGIAEPIEGASNDNMSSYFAKYSPDGKWIVFCKANSFMLLQPDSRLYIMSANGGKPREMKCNTNQMNSWHSWSPNSKWLVFSSKVNSPYTQLFLTHIDEDGNDSPPVLLSSFVIPERAINIPEFVNIKPDGIKKMHEAFVDYYSYANKGGQLLDEDQFDEAEKLLRKSIEIKPDYADAHDNLGFVLLQKNKIEEAEKEYKIALKLNPKSAKTHQNLGALYLERNEYDKAQKALETSLKIDPEYSEAHEGIGVILQYKKDIDGAQRAYETAIRYKPGNANAHYRLGTIYMTKEEYDKAEKAFRAFYKIKPKNPRVYFMLGKIFSMKDETVSEAISMYKKSISLDPSNTYAYIGLGNLYLKNGDRKHALSEFEKAIKIDPNDQNLRAYITSLKQQR